jgi:hypothetical protein
MAASTRTLVALVVVLAAVAVPASVVPATAQSGDQPAWADDLFADMQGMQDRYNENVDPGNMTFAQRQVYNQLTGNVINVYIVETDVVFSFRMTPDGTIRDLQQSRRDDASLRMELTRETAEDLAAEENPVPAFVGAVQDGRRTDGTVRGIVIKGERGNPVKQATWMVVNTLKGLF